LINDSRIRPIIKTVINLNIVNNFVFVTLLLIFLIVMGVLCVTAFVFDYFDFNESVVKVKAILQLDNLNVDFKYGYKIFTLNSGNCYLIKDQFILFVESNRLLRRYHRKSGSYSLFWILVNGISNAAGQ
jgi:hypothetical protein